jgi:nicotinamidase-related amidase
MQKVEGMEKKNSKKKEQSLTGPWPAHCQQATASHWPTLALRPAVTSLPPTSGRWLVGGPAPAGN